MIENEMSENYLEFSRPINLKKIDKRGCAVKEILAQNPNLNKKLVFALYDADIYAVPDFEVILNYVRELEEDIKNRVNDPKIKKIINRKADVFLSNFYNEMLPYAERLYERIRRLKHLEEVEAPKQILEAEESLCGRDAIVMLVLVRTCVPTLKLDYCYKLLHK